MQRRSRVTSSATAVVRMPIESRFARTVTDLAVGIDALGTSLPVLESPAHPPPETVEITCLGTV